MNWSNAFILLIVLACPLMMVFMMRRMHGGHDNSAGGNHPHTSDNMHSEGESLDDLRRQRDELDREIEERETEEQTPAGSGWR